MGVNLTVFFLGITPRLALSSKTVRLWLIEKTILAGQTHLLFCQNTEGNK